MSDFGPLSHKIIPIPIRADLTVNIFGLPLDLTLAEAAKLSAVIMAYAGPAEPGDGGHKPSTKADSGMTK